MTVLVLNGPNLGRLGTREPELYGSTTYAELEALCVRGGAELGLDVQVRQSDHEGQLIAWLHEAADADVPVVLNAGGLTHTSVALGDACAMLTAPLIEVHISNVFARESFRHSSFVSAHAAGIIAGLGVEVTSSRCRGSRRGQRAWTPTMGDHSLPPGEDGSNRTWFRKAPATQSVPPVSSVPPVPLLSDVEPEGEVVAAAAQVPIDPAPRPVEHVRGRPQTSGADLVERTADFALAQTPHLLSVLDIGCGDGALLHEIALRVPYAERYVGVDPDPSVLTLARRRPDSRIDYLDADAGELPFADGSFDLVISLRSAHLWADQEAALGELRRVLHRRGRVVIVDRLADSAKGAGRIRSGKALRKSAERLGFSLAATEVVSRRLAVLPSVRGFVLIL